MTELRPETLARLINDPDTAEFTVALTRYLDPSATASVVNENGDWLSEDYAFCRRVSELGDVDVNAYVGDGVGHVGKFVYGGPYIERLKSGIL